MAIINCTLSSHNQTENFGDNWGQGQINAIQLTITPDPGFVVSAQDFSWIDAGVSFDDVQPSVNQFRFKSDSDTFVYNLNQALTFESAEVPDPSSTIVDQVAEITLNGLVNQSLETVLDNDTAFPRYVTFSNSTTPNTTNNVVIVNVEMYDGFTMPNGDVSMRLDINGLATSTFVVVDNDEDEDEPDDPIVSEGGQGFFSITPTFVTKITANYPGATTSTNNAGNNNIPDGCAFTTLFDYRAVGWDPNGEGQLISDVPSSSSMNVIDTSNSLQEVIYNPSYFEADNQGYWSDFVSGTSVQGQLNRASAFYNSSSANENNNVSSDSLPSFLGSTGGLGAKGYGKIPVDANIISSSFPFKTTTFNTVGSGQGVTNSYRSSVSLKYGDTNAGGTNNSFNGNMPSSNINSKQLRRPGWGIPGLSNNIPTDINWQGGRIFSYETDVDGNFISNQQTLFQPFSGHYSQTQSFFIRATDGFAINKNRFQFPYGLSNRGYITGQIAKPVNPTSDQPAPQYAVNSITEAQDDTSGVLLGSVFAAGTYDDYLKKLYQGNETTSGFKDENGFNIGDLNENMPTLVREPAVFLSNKLSEKRTDVIEYIQFQNSKPFVGQNPLQLLEAQGNLSALSGLEQNFVNQYIIFASSQQNSYDTWVDNYVQVIVKFNENFLHNFAQDDGTLYPNVKILIPFDPNVISGSGVTNNDSNTGVIMGMGINTGSSGIQGLLIESTTNQDSTFTQTVVNRRGESNEETVLRVASFVPSNVRTNICDFKITAPTGKYFRRQPSFVAENNLTNKTVKIELSSVEKDSNNRALVYNYSIKYKNKNKVTLADNLKYNITSYCLDIPQDDGVKLIKSVDVGTKSIRAQGGLKTIVVKGDPGAEFEIQVNKKGKVEGGLDGATILSYRNIDYYQKEFLAHDGTAACLRATINQNGEYRFNVNIPSVNTSTEYKVIVEGRNTSKLANDLQDVYTIKQLAKITLTFTCTDGFAQTQISTTGNVRIGEADTEASRLTELYRYNASSTLSFTVHHTGGNNIVANLSSPGTPMFLQSPTTQGGVIKTSDFTNSDPDLNGGTDVEITNVAISGFGSDTVTVTYRLFINKFGTEDVTFNLNLNPFIAITP
tara:strand:- start:1109 stop:4450 length:3342 start_codon:yes stop_codon:yes gene_type:complete